MALVQTQVLTLPKIKTNSANNANRIPIVQHLIKDEDIIPLEVTRSDSIINCMNHVFFQIYLFL